MDSPVRQQQKRNDYLRHKLFRKINRRRRAKRQQDIEAPAKELKKRLRQKRTFEDGKDGEELPYPLRTSRDYDDNLAYQSGLTRDPKTGHMMSTTQEEYPKERTYLKTPSHPTYSLAVWGDKLGGYDVYNRNGKTYSAPTFSELMYTKPPFKYADGKDEELLKELDQVQVDAEGNVVDPDTGAIGTVRLPDVMVTRMDPRKPIVDRDGWEQRNAARARAERKAELEQIVAKQNRGRFVGISPINALNDLALELTPEAAELARMNREDEAAQSAYINSLPSWRKPFAWLQTVMGATGADMLNPGIGAGLAVKANPLVQASEMAKKYQIMNMPRYHIKSLQRGNILEKQLSKQGTISTNSIRALADNKNTSEVDRYILNKVLENHAGEKAIDYNTLRQEAQDMIPEYRRVSQNMYADYGADRLGFSRNVTVDEPYLANVIPEKYWKELGDFNPNNPDAFDVKDARELYLYDHPDIYERFKQMYLENKPTYNTFTFESPGILGNTKHYSGNPIGHSRTYTTRDEPDVLHVMESQSDWAQNNMAPPPVGPNGPVGKAKKIDRGVIENRMTSNYLQRQLQENMLYGAQQGQRRMRYPTSETAAKIEGYNKMPVYNYDEGFKDLATELNDDIMRAINANPEEYADFDPNDLAKIFEEHPHLSSKDILNRALEGQPVPYTPEMVSKLDKLKSMYKGVSFTYSPRHQTILKKYADFPKLFGKTFKGQQVRTINDKLGNSWYEVDIPDDMLTRELIFSTANPANQVKEMSEYRTGKDSGIYIKPENRGKFTRLKKRTGHSTAWFKAHGTPAQKKMATFAQNAKKWHH